MSLDVPKTKLLMPRVRPDAIQRPRLMALLETASAHPLILVSAEGGAGKTTLISQWIEFSNTPYAWLSLSPHDNTPAQFLFSFAAALQAMQPTLGIGLDYPFHPEDGTAIEAIVRTLLNEIEKLPECWIVLDDYHVITSDRAISLMPHMIDHIPAHIHLIISTRADPPWPSARYRANGTLFEIRGSDLRFTAEEAGDMLGNLAAADVPRHLAQALTQRTEGWAAGLQLAGLSLRGRNDFEHFAQRFSGANKHVADYLIEEVLSRQSADVQDFLVQTSILEQLCADLCEAITDCCNGEEMLRSLQHANLFLVALDDEGRWYRYHHLFVDLLRNRLHREASHDVIRQLHQRASRWFESTGSIVESIQHSIAAVDDRRTAALVDEAGLQMIFSTQSLLLQKWLAELPSKEASRYPRLSVYRMLLDLATGQMDMLEQTLQEAEVLMNKLPSSPQDNRLRLEGKVRLALSYAFQNTRHTIRLAKDALEGIDQSDLITRSHAYSALYRAYGMQGDAKRSESAYNESLRLALAGKDYSTIANTTMIRSFDLAQYGRLSEASRICNHFLEATQPASARAHYPSGQAFIGLAGVHLERFELTEAEEMLEHGLALCREGSPSGLFTGAIQRSRLLQAQGRLPESLRQLEHVRAQFNRREFTLMAREVSIRLAIGDLDGVERLIPFLHETLKSRRTSGELPLIAAESFRLSLARISIAQGELDHAVPLLNAIEASATPDQRRGRLIEVFTLRAHISLLRAGGRLTPDAIAHLAHAIELAVDPGFALLFYEEGSVLAPILEAISERAGTTEKLGSYAARLLALFGWPSKSIHARLPGLIENLTPREFEVLQCIADGDSNQQIADRLSVTVRTVKKHASNVFLKLQVHSRTKAVAKAREIGLLTE